MKLTNSLLLAAAFGLFVNSNSHALTLEDRWSDDWAWTASNQPDFTNGVGGILHPDISVDSGAELTVANATSGGIYSAYYYTLFSTPSFDLSTTNILSDVETITLSMVTTAAFTSTSAALDFGGLQTVSGFSSQVVGEEMGSDIYSYTWTWDVAELVSPSSLSIGWITPAVHTAYYDVSLIQAVPEPHEYALGVVALLGVAAFVRRRRMACAS